MSYRKQLMCINVHTHTLTTSIHIEVFLHRFLCEIESLRDYSESSPTNISVKESFSVPYLKICLSFDS